MNKNFDKKQYMGVGVGVLILNDYNQILLGKRHKNQKKDDSKLRGERHWTMPGGKIDFREKMHDAAIREVKEETNLDIKIKDLELIALNEDMLENVHFLTVGFLAKKWSGEVCTMEPEQITEWQWFDMDNLPEKIFLPSKKLLNNFIQNKLFIYNN